MVLSALVFRTWIQIARLKLQHRVELRGWVTEEEKLSLIQRSDAVIIPSRNLEEFSLLALEALGNGTPVLLTEAVGVYEYVRDVDQDFVMKIDLDDPKVEMQEFLSKGNARSGLDRLEILFDAERIGQTLFTVLMPEGPQAVEPPRTSTPKTGTQQEMLTME